jgi:hypothetical protein
MRRDRQMHSMAQLARLQGWQPRTRTETLPGTASKSRLCSTHSRACWYSSCMQRTCGASEEGESRRAAAVEPRGNRSQDVGASASSDWALEQCRPRTPGACTRAMICPCGLGVCDAALETCVPACPAWSRPTARPMTSVSMLSTTAVRHQAVPTPSRPTPTHVPRLVAAHLEAHHQQRVHAVNDGEAHVEPASRGPCQAMGATSNTGRQQATQRLIRPEAASDPRMQASGALRRSSSSSTASGCTWLQNEWPPRNCVGPRQVP